MLAPLATLDDLDLRGVDISDTARASTMLQVASAALRNAAGSAISETTSTVKLTGSQRSEYLRLPGVVRSVSSVKLDDEEVTGWQLVDGMLYKCGGWSPCRHFETYEVTYTHGLPQVSADIVDLVCSFAAAGMNAAVDGYAARTGVIAERIDDYSVQYAQGADAVANVMEVPPRTRRLLRSRFGAGAGMVGSR